MIGEAPDNVDAALIRTDAAGVKAAVSEVVRQVLRASDHELPDSIRVARAKLVVEAARVMREAGLA